MPELPEVETIRRQLGEALVGKVVEEVEVLSSKSFDGDQLSVVSCQVVGVRRFGKALVIDLRKAHGTSRAPSFARASEGQAGLNGKGKMSLVIHLKMTGQLIYEPHGEGGEDHLKHRVAGGHPTGDFVAKLPSSHTRVIIRFKGTPDAATNPSSPAGEGNLNSKLETRNSKLFFNDQRKFGWVKLMETKEVEKLKFIQGLGKEPWSLSDEEWVGILKSSRKPVKVRIMDQEKVSGVGNIYVNDACWEAGIDPRRESRSLGNAEALNLLEALKKVLEEGIKYGGATAGDGKYVDMQGLGGKYQEHFRVYQREGKECLRKDGGVIQKATVGGRGTFWCEVCQK